MDERKTEFLILRVTKSLKKELTKESKKGELSKYVTQILEDRQKKHG